MQTISLMKTMSILTVLALVGVFIATPSFSEHTGQIYVLGETFDVSNSPNCENLKDLQIAKDALVSNNITMWEEGLSQKGCYEGGAVTAVRQVGTEFLDTISTYGAPLKILEAVREDNGKTVFVLVLNQILTKEEYRLANSTVFDKEYTEQMSYCTSLDASRNLLTSFGEIDDKKTYEESARYVWDVFDKNKCIDGTITFTVTENLLEGDDFTVADFNGNNWGILKLNLNDGTFAYVTVLSDNTPLMNALEFAQLQVVVDEQKRALELEGPALD